MESLKNINTGLAAVMAIVGAVFAFIYGVAGIGWLMLKFSMLTGPTQEFSLSLFVPGVLGLIIIAGALMFCWLLGRSIRELR